MECVQSPAAFFANRLYKAMDGAGTDDTTLIRVIVSRSEIDLGSIKDEFERIYNRTLFSAITVSYCMKKYYITSETDVLEIVYIYISSVHRTNYILKIFDIFSYYCILMPYWFYIKLQIYQLV